MLNAAEEPRRKITEGEETFGHHSQSDIGNPNGHNPTLRPDGFMNPFQDKGYILYLISFLYQF